MENKVIADMLNEIADMLTIEETKTSRFEVRAYRNASMTVGTLQEPIEGLYAKKGTRGLTELPGIGKGIASNIEEFIKTGKIRKYDDLKGKYPIDFRELTSLEGMGAKKAVALYRALKVKDIASLKKALSEHKIKGIQGFGEKSEELLKRSISLLEASKGRLLLGDALPMAESIIKKLASSNLVEKAVIAGSARRMKETVGDIDILAISKMPEKAMEFFKSMDDVQNIIVSGPTKTTVWLKIGISCDLRVIAPKSFGAAQQYFIGNREHNIELRKIAMKKGYKLNEYGLFDSRNRIVASLDERDIYGKLGLGYIPPEMREARGEIALAARHRLPKLVELSDIKGDMHTHTKETDAANSIEEMAEAAKAAGLEYFATTNHTKSLRIANGMNDRQFSEFFKKVDKLNDSNNYIPILKGAEVDILNDGSFDLKKATLREMDCVVGAIHSSFRMDKARMTNRITNAIESGLMDIFAHPTGRIINRREAYGIDLEKVAEAAERSGVALEINSSPSRMDLADTNIMLVSKYRILFAINTDAHRTSHFLFLRYGVGMARRGWLGKERILNAKPLRELIKFMQKNNR